MLEKLSLDFCHLGDCIQATATECRDVIFCRFLLCPTKTTFIGRRKSSSGCSDWVCKGKGTERKWGKYWIAIQELQLSRDQTVAESFLCTYRAKGDYLLEPYTFSASFSLCPCTAFYKNCFSCFFNFKLICSFLKCSVLSFLHLTSSVWRWAVYHCKARCDSLKNGSNLKHFEFSWDLADCRFY